MAFDHTEMPTSVHPGATLSARPVIIQTSGHHEQS